jgi:hypothetical protein
MYVLVRNDLEGTYRIVQGSHALAQYALSCPVQFAEWGNSTIVYLAVRNLIEMKAWKEKLLLSNKMFSTFYEPDLDGQLTGIACYDTGVIFKDLKTA